MRLRSTSKAWPFRYRFVKPLPEVDWVQQGVVGPVKNQHVNGSKCGCCWAFATIGVVESINAMATGELVSLSEQQLLDCDHAGGAQASIAAIDCCLHACFDCDSACIVQLYIVSGSFARRHLCMAKSMH